MTQLYITKIVDDNTYNYENFLQGLPDKKKNKIVKYRFRKDVLMSLIGEALLRYGLKRQYGIIEELSIRYGVYGKPYLADYNIFYNISHSGDYVICVISNAETGCDIQKMDYIDEEELAELAWNFFSYKEAIELQKINDKRKYFYELWTLKESYLKFCGDGLLRNLSSFSFIISDKIIFETSGNVEDSKGLRFWLNDYGKEYKVAVCSIDNIDEILLHTVDSNIIRSIINIS